MQNKIVRVQNWHDVEGEIAEVHEPRPHAKRDHHRQGQFRVDAQQRQEGQREVAEDDYHADVRPTPFFADHVPKGFFRHVGVPDDEVLREMDVGVENREGQQQRTDKVKLDLMDDLPQRTLPFQKRGGQIDRGQRHPDAAGKIIDSIHRGKPFMIQGLHPHDGRQRQGDRERKNSPIRIAAHFVAALRRPRLVLFERPMAKPPGEPPPHRKTKRRHKVKHRQREQRQLGPERVVRMPDELHPRINLRREHGNRQEQNPHHRQQTSQMFAQPPDRHRPPGIEQVMHQDQEQPAQTEAEE